MSTGDNWLSASQSVPYSRCMSFSTRTLPLITRPTRGTTTAEKSRGPRFGSQHRALVPRTRSKAGLGVGCGMGSSPPVVRVRGYHPGKFFENSDAKSCILVTLAVKFLAFWKLRPRSWGTNTLLVPNLKVGGPCIAVSPGPYTVVAPMRPATAYSLVADLQLVAHWIRPKRLLNFISQSVNTDSWSQKMLQAVMVRSVSVNVYLHTEPWKTWHFIFDYNFG